MAFSRSREIIDRRSRWLMTLALLGTFLLATLLVPTVASAHAALLETSPIDGAVLDAEPDLVTLTFNEEVQVVPQGMQLFNSDGPVSMLESAVSGSNVEITLPADLTDGTYIVGWRVISLDAHPISGALTFSIGTESDAPVVVPESSSDIMPVMGVVTGIAYVSMLLATGILWFRVFIVHQVDRQSVRIAMVASIISALAHLLLIPLTMIREVGESVSAIVDPDMWDLGPKSLTLRAFIFIVVGLGFAIHYAPAANQRRLAKWGVVLGGLLALGSLTIVGHTTTVGPTALVHGADFIHGMAGASWFGGLIGLAMYIVRSINGRDRGDGPTASETAEVVARFSWIGGVFLLGLALSGSIMAVRILETWDAFLHTTYGKVLIAKLLVLLIPVGLAAWNRFFLVPGVERETKSPVAWERLRIAVLAEATCLFVVVGITGFLVLQNPTLPSAAAGETAAATIPFEQTSVLGDGSMEVSITPGISGDNEITVIVLDADGNPLELVNDPDVRLTLKARELGPLIFTPKATDQPGVYAGDLQIPLDGDWTVEVVTRVDRFSEPITTMQLTIPHTSDAVATPVRD